MATTDGAVHQVAGTGTVAVSSPAGLRWHITSIPSYLGTRPTSPRRYVGLGSFALGDASSFGYHVPLELADQLVLPIADGVVRVSFDLVTGAAATLTELVAVPDRTKLQVFDRNPLTIATADLAWNPANTAQATLGTYTVPAGRRLMLTSARVRHVRVGAPPAASVNAASGWVQADNVGIIVRAWAGYLVNLSGDEFQGELYLPAGTILRTQYANTETGSGFYTTLAYAGVLFDA